jgi:hypothetical protein
VSVNIYFCFPVLGIGIEDRRDVRRNALDLAFEVSAVNALINNTILFSVEIDHAILFIKSEDLSHFPISYNRNKNKIYKRQLRIKTRGDLSKLLAIEVRQVNMSIAAFLARP